MTKSSEDKLEKVVKADIKSALYELWPDHWHLMVVPSGWGGVGTFDHIVAAPVEITPEMVGKTYAMFIGIEAKKDAAKLSDWKKIQRLTASKIISLGGFAMCVFGRKDIPEMIERLKRYYHIG